MPKPSPPWRQEHRTSDLVVFSELFLVGYPPRDLLEKPALIRQVQEALDHLVALSARYPDTGILVGAPQPTGRDTGKGLCNCAVLIHQGAGAAAPGQIAFAHLRRL